MKRVLFLMGSLILFVSSMSFALPPPYMESQPPPPPVHPCAEDAQTYCEGVEPGGGRLIKCLKKNKDEISPECWEKMEETKQALKALKKICKEERKKFCKKIKGQGNIIRCLREHSWELSEECHQKSMHSY